MYYINYGTGAGNQCIEGTLDQAKETAEENLCYTQEDVKIQTDDGDTVSILKWYGVEPQDDDVVTARFGDSGFYSEWWDL